MFLYVPESSIGPHGETILDEREAASFLEKIISIAEPNSEKWSALEESLGKLDYGEVFDYVPEVYDKDGDLDFWKTSYNNEDMAANLKETIPYIKDFFKEWINTINLDGAVPSITLKKLIKKDSLFLTFNYTETLEKVYKIDSNNICHIHGKQGQEIFFGHGDNSDHTEEYMSHYIGAESALSQLDAFLRKDTQLALQMNSKFFEQIDNTIEEIYSIGCSFGEVDLIYIKEICKKLSHKTVWYLNDYDRDKFSDFQTKLRICGFKGKFKSFGDEGIQ